MPYYQSTIKKKIIFEGLGLHSGASVKMVMLPAKENTGIVFFRKDIKNSHPILANWRNITKASLCTQIKNKYGQEISTVEHLMFSFYSLGITNLKIEINGPEVPIMDGSAKIFIHKLKEVGICFQKKEVPQIKILKFIEIKDGNKSISYAPSSKNFLEIDYTIEYNDQFIKKQNYKLTDAQKNFELVASSRTFCHQEDLEKIFAMGLAKGGSLDNAVVISGSKILNQEGLRYKDEFVRHKILDCLGDLFLSGFFINGKISCHQGGHELTASLIKKLFSSDLNFILKN